VRQIACRGQPEGRAGKRGKQPCAPAQPAGRARRRPATERSEIACAQHSPKGARGGAQQMCPTARHTSSGARPNCLLSTRAGRAAFLRLSDWVVLLRAEALRYGQTGGARDGRLHCPVPYRLRRSERFSTFLLGFSLRRGLNPFAGSSSFERLPTATNQNVHELTPAEYTAPWPASR
jgi:hypothetical protein